MVPPKNEQGYVVDDCVRHAIRVTSPGVDPEVYSVDPLPMCADCIEHDTGE